MSKEQESIIKRLKFYIDYGVGTPLNIEDYKEIIKALKDLQVYKLAFEKATDNEGRTFIMVCVSRNKTKYVRDYFLDQARKELSNERH